MTPASHRKSRDYSWIQRSLLPAALGIYIVVKEMSKASSNPAIVGLGALMCNALPVAVLQAVLQNSVLGKTAQATEEDEADG